MGKLSRPGLGKVHAVAGAQPTGLTFDIGAGLSIASLFVNEAVPNVDVDDACLVGSAAVKVVEKRDVCRGFLPAQRGQPDPEHRYSRRFEGRNRVVDAPGI